MIFLNWEYNMIIGYSKKVVPPGLLSDSVSCLFQVLYKELFLSYSPFYSLNFVLVQNPLFCFVKIGKLNMNTKNRKKL